MPSNAHATPMMVCLYLTAIRRKHIEKLTIVPEITPVMALCNTWGDDQYIFFRAWFHESSYRDKLLT
jgi:hypothetical protein